MSSKADNYMNEGCFQSASSCGKYPYIDGLYLQIIFYIASHSMKIWGFHFG